MDITWGAGGSTSKATLDLATTAQKYHGVDIMMHLTCANMTKESVKEALLSAREGGIRNILALRGDPVKGEEWEMKDEALVHGIDLVRLIKEEHGDYFGIAVAGHPGSTVVHEIYLFVFFSEERMLSSCLSLSLRGPSR